MAGLTFSVGIPAFNQGAFLPETLESLLAQTHPPLEIVISDHFSTDNTAQIIADYGNRYPGLVRGTQPPAGAGISGQWNHTLASLRGDWLTLLSSDDLARPNFVETFLRGALRAQDAVLVRAAWENIDAQGRLLGKNFLLSVKPVTRFPDNLLEQRRGPKASFAAFAVSRQALLTSGGYPPGFESFGDWPLFAQLAPYGSFVYEDQIVSGYRVGHDGDKFRKRLALWIHDEVRMFQEVLPRAAAHGGMKAADWITATAHENFVRYLSSASETYASSERSQIAPLFAEWARMVNAEPLLASFAAGETVHRPVTLRQHIKRVLRPTVQKAYALLRQR